MGLDVGSLACLLFCLLFRLLLGVFSFAVSFMMGHSLEFANLIEAHGGKGIGAKSIFSWVFVVSFVACLLFRLLFVVSFGQGIGAG